MTSQFTGNRSISQKSPNVTKYHKMPLNVICATRLLFALTILSYGQILPTDDKKYSMKQTIIKFI